MEQITNKPARRRRSTHEILNILIEFEKTSMSVKEFCMMHNISKAAFHNWQSRHKSNADERSGLADLHIISSAANTPAVLGLGEVGNLKNVSPNLAQKLIEGLHEKFKYIPTLSCKM